MDEDERKNQELEEEEQENEEELENDATETEDSAGGKFEHSMDEDDESEDDEQDKKKKKKKDDDDEDDKDDKDDKDDEDKENKEDEVDQNKDKENNEDISEKDDLNDKIDTDDKTQEPKEDTTDELDTSKDPKEKDNSNKKKDPNEENNNNMAEEPEGKTPTGEDAGSEGFEGNTSPETATNSTGPTNGAETATEGITPATEGATPAVEGTGAAVEGTGAAVEGTGAAVEGTGAAVEGTGAAVSGTAAGGTAAAGETAAAAGGTAAAGGAAAVAWPILIIIAIIILIIILIGVVGFFTTMPQFLMNKLKKLAQDIWDGLEGYVIGQDESTVNKEDIIGVAQYLYDMGYDLEGMGFAEEVEIYGQKDRNGKEITVTEGHVKNEIKSVDAPYLRAYLVAENRTYLVNNYTFNLKDYYSSIFDFSVFEEGAEAWGTGLIDLDTNLLEDIGMPVAGLFGGKVGELIKGVRIERESNTMRIRRLNPELAVWKTHNDYTYFSLEGWTGRYGKPFELLLTLHIATMAPDLVYEFAMNEDLDAKAHVKTHKTEFSGKVYVDGKSIDQLKEDGTYDEGTIKNLREIEKDYASEIKTAVPYISSVTKHWFRNVYFEGTDSEDASSNTNIGIDEDEDGIEDYNEQTGVKTQKTRKLSSSDDVYEFGGEEEVEFIYNKEVSGVTGEITFKGTLDSGVTQTKDAVRGTTNPTTKKLFQKKYYIYDGTITRARQIQKARKAKDDSIKENIQFTRDSLTAFAMLEQTETLDAQYVYRDLKELVIELGYFEREDFNIIEKQVLEWPIPDYIPGEWPDREIEKQELDYGTLIACDETMAASLGMSLEDLQQMTGTDEESTNENDEDEMNVLNNCLFIGDSYISGLEQNGGISNATFKGKNGATPQYWIDNIKSLPDNANKICIYLGVNNPTDYQSMKDLIDILVQKYEGTSIYVIEVMHLGKNYSEMDVDDYNKKIDTYNSHIREKCKTMDKVTFIDASKGLVSGGYLANPDSTGVHLKDSEDYKTFAKNIALEMKDTRRISTNDTDEKFVVEFLKASQEISEYIKENNFEYGNADYIPPQTNGSTTSDGKKKITSDRFVSWALNKCGYKDQPECGLTVGENGDFIEYCEEKEWKRITSKDEVQAGDIVFEGKLDDEGKKASKVYICAGKDKRYECTSDSQITSSQPIKETIGSDFLCAYRVTGGEPISTGFTEDLDVIAMGNGKVIELLDSSNNLFSLSGLSQQIDGNGISETDEVQGREQTLEGIRIKLTDTALKGYTLIIFGFDVDDGITEGQTLKVNDVIGKTVNSDICMILLDRDRAVIEDIENYIKVPKKISSTSGSSQPYKPEPGDDIILANMMHHEGCTNCWQGSSYGSHSKDEADILNMITGYVLLNRAIVNYEGYGTTIVEQLQAPGQYATAYVTNNKEIECLECYENALKCLQYDCDYAKNPKGEAMTRNVLGQSGWCACKKGTATPGQECFWWVDSNSNGVPDEYIDENHRWDTFFCYVDEYEKYNK